MGSAIATANSKAGRTAKPGVKVRRKARAAPRWAAGLMGSRLGRTIIGLNLFGSNYVFTDATVAYRALVNGRTVTTRIPWERDSTGKLTRATNPCVNGFLNTVAGATGYCVATVNQAPVTAGSRTKRGDGWTPAA